MSFAIHLFMGEKFSEESYRRFLDIAQKLFGDWKFEETVTFNRDSRYLTIHECWIKSENLPSDDSFRVNVEASKHLKDVTVWDFDYEWHLRLETGAGRSPVGLAVQFGAWILAMRSFRFNLALDRDSCLENEPTEFRSIEAAVEHTRHMLGENLERFADLKRRGIVTQDGYLSLPPSTSNWA